MRAALQIHRDMESVDLTSLVLDLDLQQFLLRKDLFHNLPAQRQPRRFPLEPLILLEQRLMSRLKSSKMIGFFRGEPLEHQSSAVVFRFPRGIGIEKESAALDGQRQLESVSNHGRLEALLRVEVLVLTLLTDTGLTDAED